MAAAAGFIWLRRLKRAKSTDLDPSSSEAELSTEIASVKMAVQSPYTLPVEMPVQKESCLGVEMPAEYISWAERKADMHELDAGNG